MLKVGTSSRHIANRSNGSTLTAQALAILKGFGSNAHLYLPGVGMVNGITAGNYLDSAGTTAATVDGLVGLVTDSLGAVNASQSTGANRPTERRGVVNLALNSKNAAGAAWAANAVAAISGNLLTPNNSVVTHGVSQSITTNASATTLCFEVRPNGYTKFGFRENTATGAWATFDCTGAGSVLATNLITTSAIDLVSSGNYRITLTYTAGGGANTFAIYVLNAAYTNAAPHAYTYAGDQVSGMYLDAFALFTGTLTAAQILSAGGIPLTTTTAASSTAGNYALQFNGSSNYLSLSAPLFQQTDDWCVVAGAQSNSAAAHCVFSNAAGGASEALPEIGFDSSGHAYLTLVGGGTTVTLTSSSTYIGTPVVICARKVGSTIVLRVNGVQVATGSTSGTYTTATNGAIGALPRSSVTDYHLGMIYGMPIIKGTVTDADMLTQERWVAGLTAPVSGMVAF